MDVQDKVFVVTGGGNGIGREVVLALLQRGGRVAAVDLREEALQQTASLAGATDRLTLHTCDVGDREAVSALAEEVVVAHGQVDGLLNVAGIIQQFVPFAELDYPEMEKVLRVNLWGVIHTTKAFLPHLVVRPQASLVNVSSMGGFLPVPGQTLYGASKAAVKLLTEGIYSELRGTGVKVSTVFPGAIATQITANSGVTTPGQATPEEVATEAATPGPAEVGHAESTHKLTSAPDAATIIVEQAVIKGRFHVTVGQDATFLDRFVRLAPQRATDFIAKKMADLVG